MHPVLAEAWFKRNETTSEDCGRSVGSWSGPQESVRPIRATSWSVFRDKQIQSLLQGVQAQESLTQVSTLAALSVQ